MREWDAEDEVFVVMIASPLEIQRQSRGHVVDEQNARGNRGDNPAYIGVCNCSKAVIPSVTH